MAIARSIIGPNYDTFFEPAGPGRPARLRIRLKVTLIPLDPTKAWARSYHPAPLPGTPPGLLPPSDLAATSAKVKRGKVQDVNGKFFTCSTWLTADWLEFNRRFKSTVEHAWNNQMMFVPVEFDDPGQSLSDADFGQLIGNPKVPAHVEGTLEVDLQAPGTIGHAVIEVAHLVEPSAPFRHQMTRISDHSVVYGRHMFKKKDDPLDIGGKTGQIAAAHEIGHWLREPGKALFDHIDRAKALKLPAGQQDDAQYGETLSAFSSLMGAGSVVGRYEATPWITRLRQHVLPAKVAWLYVHKLSYNPGPADVWAHQKRVLLAEKFLPKILQDAGG